MAQSGLSMRADVPSPARVWNRLAFAYDWQLFLERRSLVWALDLADPGPDERFLDLGTGTGALLRKLARRPVHPRDAVGVDAAEKMLRRVPPLPSGWKLVKADVRSLPLPASSFEVAAGTFLLQLLDSRDLAVTLEEVRRVLVPGGRLVTVTPIAPRGFLARPFSALVGTAERLAPTLFGGLRFFDPREALLEAGFVVRESVHVSGGYPSLVVLCQRK